jgi:hypothetical protein
MVLMVTPSQCEKCQALVGYSRFSRLMCPRRDLVRRSCDLFRSGSQEQLGRFCGNFSDLACRSGLSVLAGDSLPGFASCNSELETLDRIEGRRGGSPAACASLVAGRPRLCDRPRPCEQAQMGDYARRVAGDAQDAAGSRHRSGDRARGRPQNGGSAKVRGHLLRRRGHRRREERWPPMHSLLSRRVRQLQVRLAPPVVTFV